MGRRPGRPRRAEVHRRERRRGRAGHLQGPPSHGGRSAPAARGHAAGGVRGGRLARHPLYPRRGRAFGPALATALAQASARGWWAIASSAPTSRSTSRFAAAPAASCSARRLRCSSRSKAGARCPDRVRRFRSRPGSSAGQPSSTTSRRCRRYPRSSRAGASRAGGGRGTKLFGLSGHVRRPGVVEIGCTLTTLIEDVGGGRPGPGRRAGGGWAARRAASCTRATSRPLIPRGPVNPGTGGVVALDEHAPVREAVRTLLAFNAASRAASARRAARARCGCCAMLDDGWRAARAGAGRGDPGGVAVRPRPGGAVRGPVRACRVPGASSAYHGSQMVTIDGRDGRARRGRHRARRREPPRDPAAAALQGPRPARRSAPAAPASFTSKGSAGCRRPVTCPPATAWWSPPASRTPCACARRCSTSRARC